MTEQLCSRSRLTAISLIALSLCWIVPGLIGHDPWKPDEAYSFGMVFTFINGHHWLVPQIAGVPFMEKPPFFYWLAAITAHLFSPLLSLHDGARLATGLLMIGCFITIYLTGKQLFSRRHAAIALILLMGSTGILTRSHQMITDIGLLFGVCVALYGLSIISLKKVWGGILLGTGTGIGFMCKGLVAPSLLGLTCIALLVFYPEWRSRRHIIALLLAAIAALPWLLTWPILLYRSHPELFNCWLWVNNLGRFTGHKGPSSSAGFYLTLLTWFAFPAWILFLNALYKASNQKNRYWIRLFIVGIATTAIILSPFKHLYALPLGIWIILEAKKCDSAYHIPCCFVAVSLMLLSVSATGRSLYALPLVPGIVLVAATHIEQLNRYLAQLIKWSTTTLAGLMIGAFWLIWLALATGYPDVLARKLIHHQPGYQYHFHLWTLILPLLLTGIWLFWTLRKQGSITSTLISWSIAITTCWSLLAIPLLPYLDYGKSYRTMISSINAHLPLHYNCIAGRAVNDPQRAMLLYMGKITVDDKAPMNKCSLLLMDSSLTPPNPTRWSLLWQGGRPGEGVRYKLYQRLQHTSSVKNKPAGST